MVLLEVVDIGLGLSALDNAALGPYPLVAFLKPFF